MASPDDERRDAASLYNRCWELLEAPLDDGGVELLTAALTSRWLWRRVGGPDQHVMSDWMVSRAAVASGHAALGVLFAHRAHDGLADAAPDWLRASVAEGLARAYRAAGPPAEYDRWARAATGLVDRIADPESRALIAGQLAETLA